MKCNKCRKEFPPPDIINEIAYFVCSHCGDLCEVGNYEAYLEVEAFFDAFPCSVSEEIQDIDFDKVGKARYLYEPEDDRYFWAVQVWWMLDSWELRQQYLKAIIDTAPDEDSFYLGCIGAGPLEDLMAEHVLEFISNMLAEGMERSSELDKKLCMALQGFRYDPENKGLTDAEAKLIEYIQYHYPEFDENCH